MPRNPRMTCVHILTQEDVDAAASTEERAKEVNGNYECRHCRKYIWWDEPHTHRVGEKVRV